MKKYYSNAPINDREKYGMYCEQLEKAIADNDVYNIGIIASYGAGKSSLIKTYEENEGKTKKKINISLASFNEEVDNDDQEDKNKQIKYEREKRIELSVLQQIIYSKKSKHFPNSRISRIENKNFIKRIGPGCIFFLLISSIIHIIYFYLSNNKDLNDERIKTCGVCLLLSLFIILLYLSTHLFVKKVKAFDIEIEAENNNEKTSILNRFIDEIIYFFSVSKTEILVIEDLDRFNNLTIFTKLREINTILNNSECIKQKITFIYCIKDDLFNENLERAKFFEFVLSLVPVLSSKNVCDYIGKLNNELDQKMKLNLDFINKIKFFIDDYRLLNNTFNDYQLYWHELKFIQSDEKTDEKLFSMMLYKNKNPSDFSLIQQNDGEIFKLFNSKQKIIKSVVDRYNEQIKEYEDEISLANNNILTSFNDLKRIFKTYIIEHYENRWSYEKAINIDKLNTFKDKDVLVSFKFNGNDYYSSIGRIEKLENKDFYKLECNILKGKDNVIKELNDCIAKINDEIISIEDATMEQLTSEFWEDSKLFYNDENSLLLFLVSNGLIAEDYFNYAVADAETALSLTDKKFITNVLLKQQNNYDLELLNIENILVELPKTCYNFTYSLNINLVSFLFKKKEKYIDDFLKCMQLLKKDRDECHKFFVRYIKKYGIDEFIEQICIDKNSNIKNIIYGDEINQEEKISIINLILKSNDNNLLDYYNVDNKLACIISSLNPALFNINKNALKLSHIKVTFEDIKELDCYELDKINKYNLYVINYNNIVGLLNNYWCPVLFSSAYEKLNINDYIKNNINELYLCMEESCFKNNSEQTLSNILQLDLFKYGEELIKRINTKFNEIEKFPEIIINNIIKYNRFKRNWKNLNYIYCVKKMKSDLLHILNRNYLNLSNDVIDDYEIKKEILKLDINKNLLNSYHKPVTLDRNDFNDNNICELIKSNKIIIKDYEILNYYPKSLIIWYELNIDTWNITNISYSDDLAFTLLESNIPNEKIMEFINLYEEKIENLKNLDVFYKCCNKRKIKLSDELYLKIALRYKDNSYISKTAFSKIKVKEYINKYMNITDDDFFKLIKFDEYNEKKEFEENNENDFHLNKH